MGVQVPLVPATTNYADVPMVFKHSRVSPLLKKAKFYPETLCRPTHDPISNLSFLAKLTERIVLARLNDYLSSNSLLNPPPPPIWLHNKHHSTETLLNCLSVR